MGPPAGLINSTAEDLLLFAQDSMREDPVLLRRSTHLAMLEERRQIGDVSSADIMGTTWLLHNWGRGYWLMATMAELSASSRSCEWCRRAV